MAHFSYRKIYCFDGKFLEKENRLNAIIAIEPLVACRGAYAVAAIISFAIQSVFAGCALRNSRGSMENPCANFSRSFFEGLLMRSIMNLVMSGSDHSPWGRRSRNSMASVSCSLPRCLQSVGKTRLRNCQLVSFVWRTRPSCSRTVSKPIPQILPY